MPASMARMLQMAGSMMGTRHEVVASRRLVVRDDTARESAVRYAGFLTIAGAIVLGEALARIDELVSRAWTASSPAAPQAGRGS
jgi:hypothetical protein